MELIKVFLLVLICGTLTDAFGTCDKQFYPNPKNCAQYSQCANGRFFPETCGAPDQTCFDTVLNVCVWRNQPNNCLCDKIDNNDNGNGNRDNYGEGLFDPR